MLRSNSMYRLAQIIINNKVERQQFSFKFYIKCVNSNTMWVHFCRRLANEAMIIWVFSVMSEGYVSTFAIFFNLSKLGAFSKHHVFFISFSQLSVFFTFQLLWKRRWKHMSLFLDWESVTGMVVIALRFWNQVQVPISGVEWHSVALLVKPHLLKFHPFFLLLLLLLEPKIILLS